MREEERGRRFFFLTHSKDIRTGLSKAIEEFLAAHTEWKIHEVYTNNNGLTALKRVVPLSF